MKRINLTSKVEVIKKTLKLIALFDDGKNIELFFDENGIEWNVVIDQNKFI